MVQGVSAITRNYRTPDSFSDSAVNTSPESFVRYVKLPRNMENDSNTCSSPRISACMDRLQDDYFLELSQLKKRSPVIDMNWAADGIPAGSSVGITRQAYSAVGVS